jgi:hypothetical protein
MPLRIEKPDRVLRKRTLGGSLVTQLRLSNMTLPVANHSLNGRGI